MDFGPNLLSGHEGGADVAGEGGEKFVAEAPLGIGVVFLLGGDVSVVEERENEVAGRRVDNAGDV